MRKPVSKTSPKTRKTAFVPRSLFLEALAMSSVIPVCACGGSVAGALNQTVAEMAFDAGQDSNGEPPDGAIFTVAQQAFDSGVDTGVVFTVAACCFDASFDATDGASDATFGVAADAFAGDVGFVVAATGFDGSVDSGATTSDSGS